VVALSAPQLHLRRRTMLGSALVDFARTIYHSKASLRMKQSEASLGLIP
jgi:hypothetical protein